MVLAVTDPVDTLLVDVRANTAGFARDVAELRARFDGTLVEGFARAGSVLERSLANALRHGSLGFEDLRRVALGVLDAIALRSSGWCFGQGGSGRTGADKPCWGGADLLAGLLGLPGRATGGPVAPGQGYLVGERGPELFLPTSAGRIEPLGRPAPAREVRVAITVNAPAVEGGAAQALQRSSRQIAAAVRRALRDA